MTKWASCKASCRLWLCIKSPAKPSTALPSIATRFSSAMNGKEFRPPLDDEVSVWSRLLCWDYASSAEMILRYVDAKILPGYAAIDRGRIFGYSFFVYEGNKGVIGDLFVSNGARMPDPQEAEARLL